MKWCDAKSEKAGLVPAYYTNDALTNMQTGDAGSHTLIARNSVGSASSNTVVLTVVPPRLSHLSVRSTAGTATRRLSSALSSAATGRSGR